MKEKFGGRHDCNHFEDHEFLHEEIKADVIFDFTISENPEHFEFYEANNNIPLFVNTVKMTLAEIGAYYQLNDALVFGFNGLPTFINRDLLEVTSLASKPDLSIFEELGTDHQLINDRVGMVTPRIICMIINGHNVIRFC